LIKLLAARRARTRGGFEVTTQAVTPVEKARQVTDEEVGFYQENGWVLLERLISPELADAMLTEVKKVMGEEPSGGDDLMVASAEGDRLKTTTTGGRVLNARQWQDYHFMARDDRVEPLHSFAFSEEMGRNVQRLMGRDIPVRYYSDMVACKMPAGREGSSATRWHQDLCNIPLDRTGGLSVWVALCDIPPERASMRFLSGSFREGPLGRGDNLLGRYPWLEQTYELSPPLHLRPGDATVHGALTFHSAPENTTDSPRWPFITFYVPADVLYTGQPHGNFEGTDIKPYAEIEHPRFPIIYPRA
jgi:ectoine hydroxylase-related dioxygenase (phytanoyl-CoA dioxygenase family)